MSQGRLNVDWERRVDLRRLREERLERVRKAASRRGVEAVLLLIGENMRYVGHNLSRALTQGALGFRFMVFPVNRIPILYEYGMWEPYVRDNVDWLEVRIAPSIVAQGPSEAREEQYRKAAAAIKNDMNESGIVIGKVAVDFYNYGLMRALEKGGVKVDVGGGELMMEARSIKTRGEVECIRLAASMAEGAFEKVKRSIRPGVSENELRGIFVGELYRLGMEYVTTGEINSGPRTYVNNMTTSDRVIRNGDIVVAQACNSTFLGYKVCLYRTYVCGRANQEQKDCYETTRDVLKGAIRVVRPGATTKDIAEKWPKAAEFGYKNEDGALWLQWAHGIGVQMTEEPTATRLWSMDHPQRIEEGMTMALEDWLPTKERSGTYPKGQGVRLEEMVHVTSHGTDLLSTPASDELPECNA